MAQARAPAPAVRTPNPQPGTVVAVATARALSIWMLEGRCPAGAGDHVHAGLPAAAARVARRRPALRAGTGAAGGRWPSRGALTPRAVAGPEPARAGECPQPDERAGDPGSGVGPRRSRRCRCSRTVDPGVERGPLNTSPAVEVQSVMLAAAASGRIAARGLRRRAVDGLARRSRRRGPPRRPHAGRRPVCGPQPAALRPGAARPRRSRAGSRSTRTALVSGLRSRLSAPTTAARAGAPSPRRRLRRRRRPAALPSPTRATAWRSATACCWRTADAGAASGLGRRLVSAGRRHGREIASRPPAPTATLRSPCSSASSSSPTSSRRQPLSVRTSGSVGRSGADDDRWRSARAAISS